MDYLEVFDNNAIENSGNTERPTKTGQYLVYAYDQALDKYFYFLAYFRDDTKKFYLHKECKKKCDMDSFWRITPKKWIFLQDVELDEFEDK